MVSWLDAKINAPAAPAPAVAAPVTTPVTTPVAEPVAEIEAPARVGIAPQRLIATLEPAVPGDAAGTDIAGARFLITG
ncbi:hypothetical protein, partial [Couchioplanes caeruleus]